MFPYISYSDIILLAKLTSRSLLRLRNASGEDNGLAHQVSNLLAAQRQLQERAADPDDHINAPSIRQDRGLILGGCWKVVNDLDIALERPKELSRVSIRKGIYDYTLAIHLFLATTSPKTHVGSENHLGAGECAAEPIVNHLIRTLIARAVTERLPPCSYVESSKHVLEKLKATIPDIGAEQHMERIVAYMDDLNRKGTQKATANKSDATQHHEPSTNRTPGFGFTFSDHWDFLNNFMKEGKAPFSYHEDDLPSTSQENTGSSDPEPDGLTAEEARRELHRIYETLHDYQAKYELFVDQTPRDSRARERDFHTLEEHLEQNVIEELDAVLLRGNQQLRWFKKYIGSRAREMVANAVKARDKACGSRRRSRGF